jgi:hypothetical protein
MCVVWKLLLAKEHMQIISCEGKETNAAEVLPWQRNTRLIGTEPSPGKLPRDGSRPRPAHWPGLPRGQARTA